MFPGSPRLREVDAVRRTDIVGQCIIRQRPRKLGLQLGVGVGDGNARRTALPNTHEPHSVDMEGGKSIPFLRGHISESYCVVIAGAQFGVPGPVLDFINHRSIDSLHLSIPVVHQHLIAF